MRSSQMTLGRTCKELMSLDVQLLPVEFRRPTRLSRVTSVSIIESRRQSATVGDCWRQFAIIPQPTMSRHATVE